MSATAVATKKSWANIVGKSDTSSMETVAIIEVHEYHDEAPAVAVPIKTHERKFVAEKKNYSADIDPVALDIARDFYECYQSDITGFTRRNDLQQFFHQEMPQAEREFPIVLYALAKGLRLVNCFNRGQDLEWREPSKMKKKTYNKDAGASKKKTVSADGWVTVGKIVPTAVSVPISLPVEDLGTPSPRFSREVDVPVTQKPDEDRPKMSDDEIMAKIASFKADIKDLESEIEALIPFHREHLREFKRFEGLPNPWAKKLATFHDNSARNLEDMLDELQNEANRITKLKNQHCDMLKQ